MTPLQWPLRGHRVFAMYRASHFVRSQISSCFNLELSPFMSFTSHQIAHDFRKILQHLAEDIDHHSIHTYLFLRDFNARYILWCDRCCNRKGALLTIWMASRDLYVLNVDGRRATILVIRRLMISLLLLTQPLHAYAIERLGMIGKHCPITVISSLHLDISQVYDCIVLNNFSRDGARTP